ncbi:hypothetical protein HMN09_01112900 [Mycena chlorophos]|uniref:Uncharacterized protein n=1 Tax=Mycena chlorophos TaxID=658473 RepID=A0A8H6SEM4_MYCCL|nr:hypothetical protein HMN09_01112900 [Mycena chlorophos]
MSAPSTPITTRRANIFASMTQVTPCGAPSFTSSPGPENRTSPLAMSRNADESVRRFAASQHLRAEQTAECVSILRDPGAVVMAKIFVLLFSILNMVAAVVVAQPSFEPSEALLKNIKKYAMAILLSPRQARYKGNEPVRVLLNLLKTHRFDLPPGIEHNAADYDTLKRAVRGIFTQLRADIKKEVSLPHRWATRTVTRRVKAAARCDTIYKLTQTIVAGTDCVVTVELCARVALMRYIWLETYESDTSKFWDEVDALLAEIRSKAKGDQQQVTRAFRVTLKKDRETYGKDDYTITEGTADPVQQEVDVAIDEAVMNAAGAGAGDDNTMDEDGNDDDEQ